MVFFDNKKKVCGTIDYCDYFKEKRDRLYDPEFSRNT